VKEITYRYCIEFPKEEGVHVDALSTRLKSSKLSKKRRIQTGDVFNIKYKYKISI
jgi:hypothetical protein